MQTTIRRLLSSTLTLCSFSASAEEPLDAGRIKAFTDTHFQQTLEASGIPGVAVAIVRDGETVLLEGYGVADVESRAPIDPERTVFRLGSITKPFVALAAAGLVEEGVLDLDEDVNIYLEEIRVPEAFGEAVTLRHLLSHTAGFDADMTFTNLAPESDPRMTATAVERRLQRVRAPGRVSSYDVVGFGLLGLVLRDVASKPLAEVLRERVFEPLGMARSFLGNPSHRLDEMASCHVSSRPGDARLCEHPVLSEIVEGSGAAAATAADMARLMKALLGGGEADDGRRLLSRGAFADFIDFDHYRFHPFGPGIARAIRELDYTGRRAVGHGGGINGFSNDMALFPDDGMGIYVGVLGGGEQVYDARLSTIPALVPDGTVPSEAREAYAELRRFTRRFAEHFLERREGWPRRQMSDEEREALAAVDDTAALAGLYFDARYVSDNVMMNVARHTLLTRIEAAGDDAILVDGAGPYVRTAPLFYEDPETESSVAFRVTDAGTFLSHRADPHGAYEKLPWFAHPKYSLAPLLPALLLVFTTAVYLLPRFVGWKRRLGALVLVGGVFFLVGFLLELEYATLLVEVRGDGLLAGLWRWGLRLGVLTTALAPLWFFVGQALPASGVGQAVPASAGRACPTRAGRWAGFGHAVLIELSGLYLLFFIWYWSL